ncbi:MAG: transposase [Verrucomicrobiales bacterium]|nr:transposase [Verrucomicrobiales bacterium]
MKNTKSKSNQSVYRNQSVVIRSIFEQANSPKKVLCVALDYAKNKHVALCCDGNGEILKNSFPVENTMEGVDFLCEQIAATARKRKVNKKCIFLGGEDEPAYVSNFVAAIRKRGYVVARVNAFEAKKNRENFLATTDDLDLLGIAKTLLSRRARIINDESVEDIAVYRRIRSLTRARRGLVRQKTAASNRIHSSVDILFPDFLNASKSGVTPFSSVSLKLMAERFSAQQISRRKPTTLAGFLRKNHSKHPDEGASKLMELASKSWAGGTFSQTLSLVLEKKSPDAFFGNGTLAPDALKTLVQAKSRTSNQAVEAFSKRRTIIFYHTTELAIKATKIKICDFKAPQRRRTFRLLYAYSQRYIAPMLAIRLKPALEQRLDRLAKKTGRTKTFYAREAIEEHLEDLEDYYLALEVLQNPGRIYTAEEAKRELGL